MRLEHIPMIAALVFGLACTPFMIQSCNKSMARQKKLEAEGYRNIGPVWFKVAPPTPETVEPPKPADQ